MIDTANVEVAELQQPSAFTQSLVFSQLRVGNWEVPLSTAFERRRHSVCYLVETWTISDTHLG